MGDTAQKVMSIINKIQYKRRTLQKKSLVAKHGLWLVISLVALGIVIGSTSTFITLTVQDIWTKEVKGGHIVVKAVVSPTPKAVAMAEVVAEGEATPSQAEEITSKIFALESSRDKADSCHAIGKHNGYGFIPGTCYNFTEEVREYVIEWVKTHIKEGLSEGQIYCHYNLGSVDGEIPQDCQYYQDSKNIK